MPLFSDAVLDPETLRALRELSTPGDDLLAEVAEIFARESAIWLARVKDAAARPDFDAMWKAAHELRSVAANAGAFRVAALCDTVQERGLSREVRDAEELALAMAREVDRACDALRRVVARS